MPTYTTASQNKTSFEQQLSDLANTMGSFVDIYNRNKIAEKELRARDQQHMMDAADKNIEFALKHLSGEAYDNAVNHKVSLIKQFYGIDLPTSKMYDPEAMNRYREDIKPQMSLGAPFLTPEAQADVGDMGKPQPILPPKREASVGAEITALANSLGIPEERAIEIYKAQAATKKVESPPPDSIHGPVWVPFVDPNTGNRMYQRKLSYVSGGKALEKNLGDPIPEEVYLNIERGGADKALGQDRLNFDKTRFMFQELDKIKKLGERIATFKVTGQDMLRAAEERPMGMRELEDMLTSAKGAFVEQFGKKGEVLLKSKAAPSTDTLASGGTGTTFTGKNGNSITVRRIK